MAITSELNDDAAHSLGFRLSAAGQAIVSMKKLNSSTSRAESVIGPNGQTGTEELMEAMRRLRQLNEVYSR